MELTNPEKQLPFTSASLSDVTLEALRQIVPSAFVEAKGADGALTYKIDFDRLRGLLGDEVAETEDRFGFYWVGKEEAKREAAEPTHRTLRPVVEESEDWDTTENLYIEGDNLEVLKLLQRAYIGKVKMIYIDPPYNTGNDFVYNDNFVKSGEDYDKAAGNVDEEGNRLRRNQESNPRYHSDWCSMIYPRLLVARTLLSDDGVIFISIDDNEVHHLRSICDEVFGASNFVANIIWKSTPGSNTGQQLKTVTEYVLLYSKYMPMCDISAIPIGNADKYVLEDSHKRRRGKFILNKLDRRMTGSHYSPSLFYSIQAPDGTDIFPGGSEKNVDNWNFRWSKNKVQWGIENDFIVFKKKEEGGWSVYFKQYQFVDNNDRPISRTLPRQNLLEVDGANSAAGTRELMDLFGGKIFDYPKPLSLIKELVNHVASNDGIVLDFFSGSATTAHAVMQLNAEDGGHRRYIMVQLPEETPEGSEARKAGYETICDIGKERIRRAGAEIRRQLEERKSGSKESEGAPTLFDTTMTAESADGTSPSDLDTGFRVLRVGDSYLKKVFMEPKDLVQSRDLLVNVQQEGLFEEMKQAKRNSLFGQVDAVEEDRSELDLLIGCMVDWGVQLSYPLETEVVDGQTIHVVNEGGLVACFATEISSGVIRRIAELKPLRVILREGAFATDAAKLNVYEQLKQLCQWSDEEAYRRIHVL